jgi:hypothetical protein
MIETEKLNVSGTAKPIDHGFEMGFAEPATNQRARHHLPAAHAFCSFGSCCFSAVSGEFARRSARPNDCEAAGPSTFQLSGRVE